MQMKSTWLLLVVLAFFAGCQDNEAKRFGYRGSDLLDNGQEFFTLGGLVTNWVPVRVLSVFERYEYSEVEKALIAAAGVIVPSSTMERLPEGYGVRDQEPWYSVFVKEAESFGIQGKAGFVAHVDPDTGRVESGETFFSSYWPSEAEAQTALAKMKQQLAARCAPLKFWDFPGCWAAEYRRLRVIGCTGQRADGTWSCMLNIQDKCEEGCGLVESLEEQEERLANYNYVKVIKAWQAQCLMLVERNHQSVKAAAEKQGCLPLAAEAQFTLSGNTYICQKSVPFDPEKEDPETIAQAALGTLEAAAGAKFTGKLEREELYAGTTRFSAAWSGELYEARFDLVYHRRNMEAEDSELSYGEYRMLLTERILPGNELPSRPVRQ